MGEQRQREGKGHPLGMCPGGVRVPGSPVGICHMETYLNFTPHALCGSRAAWGVSWNDSGLRELAALVEARFI